MEELEYFTLGYGSILGHFPLQEAALSRAPGMIWIGAPERQEVMVREGKVYKIGIIDVIRNPDPELCRLPSTKFPTFNIVLLSDYQSVRECERVVLSSSRVEVPLINKIGKPSGTLDIGGLSDDGEPAYMRRFLYESLAMAGILPNRVYAVERWIRPGKIVKFKDVKGYWYPHPSLFVPVA
ncbi:MAG: hypothetical protein WCJ97_03880 [Phycisphaerae bacterium]